MTQITTRTTPNNTQLYVAVCDYCGKEFIYPYKNQTENNILQHMKYCKYKTRDAPQPTITQEQQPQIDYKKFYETYHKIIEQFKEQGVIP